MHLKMYAKQNQSAEWLALFRHNIKVTEIYIYTHTHIHIEHIDDIDNLFRRLKWSPRFQECL